MTELDMSRVMGGYTEMKEVKTVEETSAATSRAQVCFPGVAAIKQVAA